MKFHSKPIAEHQDVPLADDGRLEDLVAEFQARRTRPDARRSTGRHRGYVVSVGPREDAAFAGARLEEILALVRACGEEVVGFEALVRQRPDPRTFLGKGACEQLAARALEHGADLLVIDAELSPSQARNLEDATGLSVHDREAVILEVFERHAKTRRARIQVEIAHLEYLRPRIRGLGLELDQQAGGVVLGRGPGETASELLARRLDGRLAELRRAWARLERAGRTQRQGRSDIERIALVGYTNAGKTSLMNGLTSAGLSARDMPFETLDTTSRCLTRHGGDVVLSDTVGFIRRLPERLLASFESTLAEIREASLLAVVVDLSDPEWDRHLEITEGLVNKLGADALPRFYVFNKIDRLDAPPPAERLRAAAGEHEHMTLSSHDPAAVARLRQALLDTVRGAHRRARVLVPYAAGEVNARAYATCRVLDAEATERGLVLTLEGPPHLVEAIVRAGEEVEA